MNLDSLHSPRGDGDIAHIEAALTDLVAGVWCPDSNELETLLDHLSGCLSCQTTLAVLMAIQAHDHDPLPDDQLARAHQRHPHEDILDHLITAMRVTHIRAELPAYLETVERLGEATSAARFPQVVSHLATCVACQADFRAARLLLRTAVTDGLAPALAAPLAQLPDPVAPLPPPATEDDLWRRVAAGTYRLRERFTIFAGQATVAVAAALPGLSLTELAAGKPILSLPHTTIGREERLVFMLPHALDGSQPSESAPDNAGNEAGRGTSVWRCLLDLSARYDRRVDADLRLQALATAPDLALDTHLPATPLVGVAWLVEYEGNDPNAQHEDTENTENKAPLTGATGATGASDYTHMRHTSLRVIGRGVTDAHGAASLILPLAGWYQLTLQKGALHWQIPLEIRHAAPASGPAGSIAP